VSENLILQLENLFSKHGNVLLESLVLGREFSGSSLKTVDVFLLALSTLVGSDAVLLKVRLSS
jgi:hypothetical protein